MLLRNAFLKTTLGNPVDWVAAFCPVFQRGPERVEISFIGGLE
jgi:hypothetical protein